MRIVAFAERLKRAIARIKVQGEDKHGTGFLISGGYVVTARHVIAGHRPGVAVFVTFDGPPGLEIKLTEILCKGDGDGDWALLRIPSPIDREPLHLGALRQRAVMAFSTFGYARANPGGGAYHGTIRIAGETFLELYASDATNQRANVPGLSGSPCLCDGYVVGVIVESDGERGVSDGTLRAIRIDPIAAHLAVELRDPPCTPAASRILKKVHTALPEAVKKVQLPVPHPEFSDPEALCSNVAAACLRSGITMTGNISCELVPDLALRDALDLLDCAVVQWIDERSVVALQGLLEAGGTVAVLDAAYATTGKRYLVRLSLRTKRYNWGWLPLPAIPVDAPDVVRQEVRDGLFAKLRKELGDAAESELVERLRDLAPVTVVVDCIPPPSVVFAIDEVLAGVSHSILVTKHGIPSLPSHVKLVEPRVDRAKEAAAERDRTSAAIRLHNVEGP